MPYYLTSHLDGIITHPRTLAQGGWIDVESSTTAADTDKIVEAVSKIRPREDRVFVRPDAAKDKSEGGIIIVEAAQERPVTGLVVAVGPGKLLLDGPKAGERFPLGLDVGDRVWFAKHAGQLLKVEGEDLLVLRDHELVAVEQG